MSDATHDGVEVEVGDVNGDEHPPSSGRPTHVSAARREHFAHPSANGAPTCS